MHLTVPTKNPLFEKCCYILSQGKGNATTLDQNHQILEAESRGVAEQEMKAIYNKCRFRSVLFGHIMLFINHAYKYTHCLPRST